jgi:hypothetical protein
MMLMQAENDPNSRGDNASASATQAGGDRSLQSSIMM